MIELKFTVDNEHVTGNDLKHVLAVDDYRCAISEIKNMLRGIIKYQELDGKTLEMNEQLHIIVDTIQEKVFEICEDLPRDE